MIQKNMVSESFAHNFPVSNLGKLLGFRHQEVNI